MTAFGLGFGFGFGAGFSGSESTSIASSESPPFFAFFVTDVDCFALAFFAFFSPSPSSPSSSPPPLAFFFFFVGEAFPLSSPSFAFALTFFFGPFFTMSRSPDASDAVAPPSSSELDDGDPSSEEDAWKSSSVCFVSVSAPVNGRNFSGYFYLLTVFAVVIIVTSSPHPGFLVVVASDTLHLLV